MGGAVSATTWWGVSMSKVLPSAPVVAPPPGYIPAFEFRPVPASEKSFEGLIARRGLAVVYGDPGTGKTSWLMSQLYRWGEANTGRGLKVLFLALEGVEDAREWAAAHRRERPARYSPWCTSKSGLDRRDTNLVVLEPADFSLLDRAVLAAWLESVDAGGGTGTFWGLPESKLTSGQAAMEYDYITVTDPDIIVVDSLSRALDGADENDNGTMSRAAAALEYIRETFGASLIIVIHHPAAGTTHLRGGSALLGVVDSATHVARRGNMLTVKNRKARGFPDGEVKRYTRRRAPSLSLDEKEPELFRMEFDELPAAETEGGAAKAPKGPSPAPLPSEPGVLADVSTSQGEPRADSKAVEGESEPSPPTPPAHPADALQGRPAALWKALGLAPGESIPTTEAIERLKSHPVLEGVEARRRTVRLREVFDSFERRGLITGGVIQNPA